MILGLGHVAFRISNLERSLDFYCNKLGLTEAFRLNDEQGNPWIVYIKINDDNFIELFPGGQQRVEIPGGAVAYSHICLRVDDMQATLKQLAERGLPTPGEAKLGKDGNYQYWLTDPDGNRIELMQIMPDSLQARSGD